MNWHEYINKTGKIPEWPYPIKYGEETVVDCDVLIVGGGVSGCRAAIAARQRGLKVAVMDRGFTKRSGSGGAGVDHWHGAVKNPCSKVTPKMYSDAAMETTYGQTSGQTRYIVGSEGWDTLLEAESWGLQIRDEDDEYKDSMFRDEETKLLFAYDLVNRHCLRIYGADIKVVVDKEMRRLGVDVYERVCLTSFLTEGGKKGARCIGATGVHDRTGEFYIFKAKAVIVSTGMISRLFNFAPEITESQSMANLNQASMGHTAGLNAGAEFIMLEMSGPSILSGMGYAPYSTGNNNNTFQGAPTYDANGNELHYEDSYGNLVYKEEDIFKPPKDDSFIIGWGIGIHHEQLPQYRLPLSDSHFWEKTLKGEFQQPFYTDLTMLPKASRDIMWRLMLAHEGKCRVPIYDQFTRWGFDPVKHKLQFPVADYSVGFFDTAWAGAQHTPTNWRGAGGGYLTDWRLMTSLPGLFASGDGPIPSQGCHGESHTTGRYCGRQAAVFAQAHDAAEPDPAQIAAEKARVYAPVEAKGDIGWKEFNYAVSRIMADYCSTYKTEHTLMLGIRRMKDLLATEGKRMYVNNPHELARAIEAVSLGELGVAMMEGVKAHKASNHIIGHFRNDYPEDDFEERKFHGFKYVGGVEEGISREIPADWYMKAPYAADLEENYQKFGELDK